MYCDAQKNRSAAKIQPMYVCGPCVQFNWYKEEEFIVYKIPHTCD